MPGTIVFSLGATNVQNLHTTSSAPHSHADSYLRQNREMKFIATAVALLGLTTSLAAFSQNANTPQLDLPRVKLSAGMHLIDTQVARTNEQRQIGLMHRASMPQTEGMLFVFDEPATQCFWMKNTMLPLTAAFVADDGRIVNLADMKPQTTDSHCSTQPVRYVLEMNVGWFEKKGLKAGSKLSGPPFVAH